MILYPYVYLSKRVQCVPKVDGNARLDTIEKRNRHITTSVYEKARL